jgi:hypothetical protein
MTRSTLISLAGEKFGRWLVLEYVGEKRWLCRCDCGVEKAVHTRRLRGGSSQSCGCLQKALIAERNQKHGFVGHPAYVSWDGAKRRCSSTDRAHYGGKGITMHPAWFDFNVFWADMGASWREGLSIDRIDNSKGYEPGNCRWSTPKVQSNNRTNCVMVDTPSGRMNITQASEKYGINRWTIASRLKLGWSHADAVTVPVTKLSTGGR